MSENKPIDWDQYRYDDSSINLIKILDDQLKDKPVDEYSYLVDAKNFVRTVQSFQPITSRQLAGLIITHAILIAAHGF